jgi:hypothetical protein
MEKFQPKKERAGQVFLLRKRVREISLNDGAIPLKSVLSVGQRFFEPAEIRSFINKRFANQLFERRLLLNS